MAAGHQQLRRAFLARRLPRPRVFKDRLNPLEDLDEDEVFARYRFRPPTILFIVGLVAESIRKVTKRNCSLPPLYEVLCALRFFATGAFQIVIGDTLNVSQTTAGRCCRRVARALVERVGDVIRFPRGPDAISTKQLFYQVAGFPNFLGCIDGTFVRLMRPSGHEMYYVNRKGFHSLNVQMVCDARFRIISISAEWPGSTHDARIWRQCGLKAAFDNGTHDGFLLGDSGYPCTRQVLTPYLTPQTPAEIWYNTALCCTRVYIEQTYGILKKRFPCLRFGLRTTPAQAVQYVLACAMLHTIGIDSGDIVDVDRVVPGAPEVPHVELGQEEGRHVRESITRTYFS